MRNGMKLFTAYDKYPVCLHGEIKMRILHA